MIKAILNIRYPPSFIQRIPKRMFTYESNKLHNKLETINKRLDATETNINEMQKKINDCIESTEKLIMPVAIISGSLTGITMYLFLT